MARRCVESKADVVDQRGQAGEWPRLAEVQGGLEHDLALRDASREPAGRRLSYLVSHIYGRYGAVSAKARPAMPMHGAGGLLPRGAVVRVP